MENNDMNIRQIIHKYHRNILLLAYTYTKIIEDAEDIAQDVFLELEKNENVLLTGKIEQENCRYEVGYVHDGEYEVLGRYTGDNGFTEGLAPQEDGEYFFCITNLSDGRIDFSGSVITLDHDLVYYVNSVYLREKSIVTVDLTGLKKTVQINGCYIQNCETGEVYDILHASGNSAGCTIGESGNYRIYAISVTGECIDLSSKISIQYNLIDRPDMWLPL